jgi:hypothetical protein
VGKDDYLLFHRLFLDSVASTCASIISITLKTASPLIEALLHLRVLSFWELPQVTSE